MTDVAYDAWYFIPADPTPAEPPEEGRVYSSQPPMMGTMAVDAGSSVAFNIRAGTGELRITVTTTGLSAEGRGPDAMQVFMGDAVDGPLKLEAVAWERSQDSMNAVFHTNLQRTGSVVKLHVPSPPALVITKVEFETP